MTSTYRVVWMSILTIIRLIEPNVIYRNYTGIYFSVEFGSRTHYKDIKYVNHSIKEHMLCILHNKSVFGGLFSIKSREPISIQIYAKAMYNFLYFFQFCCGSMCGKISLSY